MTRTAPLIEQVNDEWTITNEALKCEMIGAMCDGSGVWENVNEYEDRQYQYIKIGRKYYFVTL